MGNLMTDVCWVVSGEDAAHFIVTACNCHTDLLEACNWAYRELEERDFSREDVLEVLAEAIRKAEEQLNDDLAE